MIADTYTIEALIGSGGMGSVFLASHKRLPGKKVAIKLLHADLAGDEVLARFRREAEIASRLGHPNIVAVHDFNVTPEGTPYLILDYLEGDSLHTRLRERQLPLHAIMTIVRQVGSALSAAHREGIVHRDLKPQNIFLVATEVDGNAVDVAKVLDFGISKIRGSQTVKTQESMLLGTPQYMAPEQAKGEHSSVDERTDVFAFGSIVYEMLTGVPPFSGASIPEVVFKVVYEEPMPLAQRVPDVPAHVIAAVERAMAKQPDARFPTASAFVEALTGAPVSIMRVPSRPPPDDAGSPSSKLRSSAAAARGPEAFDHTVDSGNHASPKPSSKHPPVNAQAQTVMSDGAIVVPPPEAKRRPRALIAILALLAAAGVAVALVVVLDSSSSVDSQVAVAADAARASDAVAAVPPAVDAVALVPDTVVAVTPADATQAPADAVVAVIPADAARAPADAAVAIAARGDAGAGRTLPPAGDPEIDRWVKQAEAAFAAKNYDLADEQAGIVFATATATPGQRSRAVAIIGALFCVKYNKPERAKMHARQLRGYLQKFVIDSCRGAGFTITPL